ncbi:GNAT family N-acetyltransferase [Microbacterium sp. A94]|uniref:GNAT family N-acetyltransferase n=1 Tax=Microbacterium sp. A94 TaxID=3450717 RepID=UPI003F41BBC6
MPVHLTRINPFDNDAVDIWWEIYAAAERADRGQDTPVWTLEESRLELQQRTDTIERRAYLAHLDGNVTASARLALPQRDNVHSAELGVHVAPALRRRGIGSAVLTLLEGDAHTAGRSILNSETSWPYAAGEDGTGIPGREFARRHGYALALGDVQSRLRLSVDAALLDGLDAEASAHSAGYTLQSWVGAVPEEVVAGWAALDAAVETEAPIGALEIEARTADIADVRATEALLAQQNRTSYGTIALDSDGRVAAFTQIVVSGDDGNAYQWGTLVHRDARGNQLGTAVKLANLRMLQAHSPETAAVYTYNAGVNEHMLAINTRLGFAPSERLGELQKRLT